MIVDQADPMLTSLSEQDCRALLPSRRVGRLGVIAGGYPMIIPVNYLMDGNTVVIRSRMGETVRSADHADVTFQVDSVDETARTGWTLLVRGRAAVVTNEDTDPTADRTRRLDLQPYAPGHDEVWIRIEQVGIAGRRVTRGWRRAVAAGCRVSLTPRTDDVAVAWAGCCQRCRDHSGDQGLWPGDAAAGSVVVEAQRWPAGID